jgi:hypothetical protein
MYLLKLASIESLLNFKDKFTVIVAAIDPSLLISLLGINIVDSLSKDIKYLFKASKITFKFSLVIRL